MKYLIVDKNDLLETSVYKTLEFADNHCRRYYSRLMLLQ